MTFFAEAVASMPTVFWLMFGVALVASAIGFFRFVYFISVGYALAILLMVIVLWFVYRDTLTVWLIVQGVLLVVYGARLGLFLVRREFNKAYRKEMAGIELETSSVTRPVQMVIWLAVAMLYVLMVSPYLFLLESQRTGQAAGIPIVQITGVIIMIIGLVLETVGDQQKAAFKRHTPGRFVDVGLYRWVRCPNYFGEIVFWIGHWVAGVLVYSTGLRWGLSAAGLVGIIYVILVSTSRLEHKQAARYGDNPEFQRYIKRTPLLIPFVPLYTLPRMWSSHS